MTTLIEATPPLFALGPRSQAMARSEMTTLNSSMGITRRTDPSFCRYDFVTPCAEAVRLFLRELGPRRSPSHIEERDGDAGGAWGALRGPRGRRVTSRSATATPGRFRAWGAWGARRGPRGRRVTSRSATAAPGSFRAWGAWGARRGPPSKLMWL